MSIWLKIFIIVAIIAALCFRFYLNDKKEAERKAVEKAARERDKKLEAAHPAEPAPLETDPRVAALKAAAGQSLRLNLMAEQAFSEMVAVAGMKRAASAQPKNPQNDPWYRRAEWTVDEGENWR